MENKQILKPAEFTQEQWDKGYVRREDAERNLQCSESHVRKLRRDLKFRKRGHTLIGDERPRVCYSLSDIYNLAVARKGVWLGLLHEVIPLEQTDPTEYVKDSPGEPPINQEALVAKEPQVPIIPPELVAQFIRNTELLEKIESHLALMVVTPTKPKGKLQTYATIGVIFMWACLMVYAAMFFHEIS